jgi:hypothetical protein
MDLPGKYARQDWETPAGTSKITLYAVRNNLYPSKLAITNNSPN